MEQESVMVAETVMFPVAVAAKAAVEGQIKVTASNAHLITTSFVFMPVSLFKRIPR